MYAFGEASSLNCREGLEIGLLAAQRASMTAYEKMKGVQHRATSRKKGSAVF